MTLTINSPLKDLGNAAGVEIGTAVNNEYLTDTAYTNLVNSQVDLIVADPYLDYAHISGHDKTRYETWFAELIATAATSAGKDFHYHTLLWEETLPWMRPPNNPNGWWTGSFDDIAHAFATCIALPKKFDDVAGSSLQTIDVVNEPIEVWHFKPDGLRTQPDGFAIKMGKDYIKKAFELTRLFHPTKKLVLNEAHMDRGLLPVHGSENYVSPFGNGNDYGKDARLKFIELVRWLVAEGAPIDAIGLQSHLIVKSVENDRDFSFMTEFMDELGTLVPEIYLSEFDVDARGIVNYENHAHRDWMVNATAKNYLDMMFAYPAVKRLVFWHMSEKYHAYGLDSYGTTYDQNMNARGLRHTVAQCLLDRAAAQAS